MLDLPLLITGANGQVGGAVARLARERGIACETPSRAALDLADAASIHRYLDGRRWRAILNCAAYTAVDRAESEPELAHAVNAVAAGILADHAARQDCPIVHVSTDYVFDGTKAEPYVETDPVAPLGVYGASKQAGEAAVHAAHPDAVIVRLSWVYAAHGSNFAKTMLRLAGDRDEIGVVADQLGRPTAAEDIAPALWLLGKGIVARRTSPHNLYHLGPQGEATWADFAAAIMDASKAAGGPSATIRRITTADYPTPAKRPANSVLDCTRIAEDWGISLPDWRESCVRVVREIVAG